MHWPNESDIHLHHMSELVQLGAPPNTLAATSPGSTVYVEHVDEHDSGLAIRLNQLGFVPSTMVKVIRVAPLGDPLEVELRGYRLSLSRKEARRVRVSTQPLAQTLQSGESLPPRRPTFPDATLVAGEPVRVLFIGNPNTGKSTLFSALTGRHANQANHPGITVERLEAEMTLQPANLARSLAATPVRIIDLPGTYGLVATSPEEQMTIDVMRQELEAPRSPVCVVVLDATALARGLHLALEILEVAPRTVFALNMMDEATANGLTINVSALQTWLGAPVIPTVARANIGLQELRDAILSQAADQVIAPVVPSAIAARIAPVLRTPAAPASVIATMRARYALIDQTLAQFLTRPAHMTRWSDRVDAVLTHPVSGTLSFGLVLLTMFSLLFWLAEPATSAIEAVFTWVSAFLNARLPDSFLSHLLVDGAIAGAGTVLTFLPQIVLLLTLLTLLEGVGYLSRAAFLIDRLMRAFGLSGKAFVPMLSGFACAVPAIFALRTLERRRDRLLTMAVIPLLSCSARLPIYSLVIAVLFDAQARWLGLPVGAWLLLVVYIVSTAFAFGALFVLSRVIKSEVAPFVLELPPYRLPKMSVVMRTIWLRAKDFVTTAGTVIVILSAVMWLLLHVPGVPPGTPQEQALEQSVAGRMGHAIEPIIAPLGFDWRIGVGLIGSFAAREVFVATMGVIHGAQASDEELGSLPDVLRKARNRNGDLIYSPRTGLSLVLFFMLACQCMSTLSVMRRETGSWAWPAFVFGYMTVLAYVVAFAAYQVSGWVT